MGGGNGVVEGRMGVHTDVEVEFDVGIFFFLLAVVVWAAFYSVVVWIVRWFRLRDGSDLV